MNNPRFPPGCSKAQLPNGTWVLNFNENLRSPKPCMTFPHPSTCIVRDAAGPHEHPPVPEYKTIAHTAHPDLRDLVRSADECAEAAAATGLTQRPEIMNNGKFPPGCSKIMFADDSGLWALNLNENLNSFKMCMA